ncbi:O-antigen ligase family protein [Gracilimonas tropica]|uniref:O-antigen ligase family protein n=1 Tax=Gracilimonas tropica TaxID=454600 RepID=UPI000375131E|nr:O-antigen ligase family protein [Gracilimonas tropica]
MTYSESLSKYLEYAVIISATSLIFAVISFKGGTYSPIIIFSTGAILLSIYLLSKIEGAFFLSSLLFAIPILEGTEGISTLEAPFYIFSLIIAAYIGLEMIRGNIITETTHDKLYLFLLLLLPVASLLGIFSGASKISAIGEITYFLGLLFYFPVRRHLGNKTFQHILMGIVLIFLGYVLIRNIINYRAIIVQAVLPWQAEKARVAANEFILLMGCCLFMSAAAVTKSFIRQIIFTLLFCSFLGGLILTQSRGYWGAFFFGAIFIFYIINRQGKRRILSTLVVLGVGLFLFASVFFGGLLDTVMEGLVTRLQSIGSGGLDVSLKDRLYESQTVLGLILQNPITGYGLGYMFTRHALFLDVFIQTSFVHNGYLATWFKLGLPGLITIITIWILNIRYSIELYNQTDQFIHKTLALGISGTMFGLLFVNNTSAQVLLFESVLFVSLFSAYLNHFLNREKT